MLDLWSVYNVAFYFGSIVLTAALLFLAWKSTHVPEQQNITVVVWQHPSGRQTLQRFTAIGGNNNLDHHNEQYGQVAVGGTAVRDISEVDSNGVLSIGRMINIVQEAVQATSVALQDTQRSNVLPSSLLIHNTENPSTSQERQSAMESAASTPSDSVQRDGSDNNSPPPSIQPVRTASSHSTNAQSVRQRSSTDRKKVAVDNNETSSDSANHQLLVSTKELDDAVSTSRSQVLADGSNEHSFSKMVGADSEVAVCSSNDSYVEEVVHETITTNQESSNKLDVTGNTCKDSDPSKYCSSADEASNNLLSKRCNTVISELQLNTEHNGDFSSEVGATSVEEVASTSDSHHHKGAIQIRLKFLDDQLKIVQGILTENVLCFKRKHFKTELSEHRTVRLIFNGRLLKNDDSSLAEYGLYDNCVVHCHVSSPKPPPAVPTSATGAPGSVGGRQGGASRRLMNMFWNGATTPDALDADDPSEEGLNISNYLSGLLWLVVAGLWVARLKHSHMFSNFSTFMLVFLTLLLVVPHYLFTVDIQQDLSMDRRTLHNLANGQFVVLHRQQAGAEQQPTQQEREQQEPLLEGLNGQQADTISPPPAS